MTLEELILSGGDERLLLDEKGLNKYYINPLDYTNYFRRGSCTCSTLTDESLVAIKELNNRLQNEDFYDLVEEQNSYLKSIFDGEIADFEIFRAPSGSDLCYFPLLFSKLINPKREILSVVTCPEELGSGSLMAYGGRYYFSDNQFGEKVEKGEFIDKEFEVKLVTFPARSESGEILNHEDNIIEKLHELKDKYAVVASLVIGSKSGIEDNLSVIEKSPEGIIWVVDMCQFRASKELIQKLINWNCMVMITGSKFYQSPPFCGAMLIPKKILDKAEYNEKYVQKFSKVFSKYDFPKVYTSRTKGFTDFKNYGLLFRWEAAIAEMKIVSSISDEEIVTNIAKWNNHIINKLGSLPDLFQLMPNQEITNNSIISFRIKRSDGSFFTHDELREIYKIIVTGKYKSFGQHSMVTIGQPVQYGEKSFIRLALGSHDMRDLVKNKFDFTFDDNLIDLIAETSRKFEVTIRQEI